MRFHLQNFNALMYCTYLRVLARFNEDYQELYKEKDIRRRVNRYKYRMGLYKKACPKNKPSFFQLRG